MSHSPPVPAGNQSPYPIQEPPHVKRIAVEPPRPVARERRARWTLLPIVTASVTVAATLGAAALMLLPARKPRAT